METVSLFQDASSFDDIEKKLGQIARLADGHVLGNLIAFVVFHCDFDFVRSFGLPSQLYDDYG